MLCSKMHLIYGYEIPPLTWESWPGTNYDFFLRFQYRNLHHTCIGASQFENLLHLSKGQSHLKKWYKSREKVFWSSFCALLINKFSLLYSWGYTRVKDKLLLGNMDGYITRNLCCIKRTNTSNMNNSKTL